MERIRLMQSVAKAKVIRGMKFQTAHSQASGRATCSQAHRGDVSLLSRSVVDIEDVGTMLTNKIQEMNERCSCVQNLVHFVHELLITFTEIAEVTKGIPRM